MNDTLYQYGTAAIYSLAHPSTMGWRTLICDNVNLERPGEAPQEIHEFSLEVLDLEPGLYCAAVKSGEYTYIYTYEVYESAPDPVATGIFVMDDGEILLADLVVGESELGARPINEPILIV
jgi:hypothetical protein